MDDRRMSPTHAPSSGTLGRANARQEAHGQNECNAGLGHFLFRTEIICGIYLSRLYIKPAHDFPPACSFEEAKAVTLSTLCGNLATDPRPCPDRALQHRRTGADGRGAGRAFPLLQIVTTPCDKMGDSVLNTGGLRPLPPRAESCRVVQTSLDKERAALGWRWGATEGPKVRVCAGERL